MEYVMCIFTDFVMKMMPTLLQVDVQWKCTFPKNGTSWLGKWFPCEWPVMTYVIKLPLFVPYTEENCFEFISLKLTSVSVQWDYKIHGETYRSNFNLVLITYINIPKAKFTLFYYENKLSLFQTVMHAVSFGMIKYSSGRHAPNLAVRHARDESKHQNPSLPQGWIHTNYALLKQNSAIEWHDPP